jgi:hypothetical protein
MLVSQLENALASTRLELEATREYLRRAYDVADHYEAEVDRLKANSFATASATAGTAETLRRSLATATDALLTERRKVGDLQGKVAMLEARLTIATANDSEVETLRGEVANLREKAAKHHAAIRVAQEQATKATRLAQEVLLGESAKLRTLPAETRAAAPSTPLPSTPGEVDYKGEYMAIGATVGACFPECEVTTLDLVRLLIHENATHRIALGLPLPAAVLAHVTADSEAADCD